jgi:glutaconate CoA-transferase, subunit B
MSEYNAMELSICVAARFLEDGATVAVGTGGPCAAAMLAQKTHAPGLYIMFEAGGMAPQLPSMPISVGDSRTFHRALMATGMCDVMEACQRGVVDYAFLGGGQIDPYGNLNSTVIGDYEHPKVRFPGSGGGNDFASFCRRTMIMTSHDARRFVEHVDFVTSPGYLDGAGARERAGLPADSGPYRVITDLAVLGFNPQTKRMQVELLHPGVTLEDVRKNTCFAIDAAERLGRTEPPGKAELEILRREVDPRGYLIGRA